MAYIIAGGAQLVRQRGNFHAKVARDALDSVASPSGACAPSLRITPL
jgi:hypothetical protein